MRLNFESCTGNVYYTRGSNELYVQNKKKIKTEEVAYFIFDWYLFNYSVSVYGHVITWVITI